MDYQQIDQFMKQSGLAAEPAFKDLHIMTAEIPPTSHSRILGLYYPEGEGNGQFGYLPPSTTVLPPDVTVSTLLHELGHRHGHYYYNELSEQYAEEYRKAHEKEVVVMRQIARQSVYNEEICAVCPESELGKSRLCMFCDYGGEKPAANILLPQPKKYRILGLTSGAVASFDVGQVTFDDVWIVDFTGNRVTSNSLTPTSQFKVRALMSITNNATGIFTAWSACVTVSDPTGAVRNYGIVRSKTLKTWAGNITLESLKTNPADSGGFNIMPDHDITLTLRVFGSDGATIATPPLDSVW